MQTFLPLPDPSFRASVEVLDYRRLGKQRVEAMQLLRALRGETTGWVNHPAVRMWRGYEAALGAYMDACIEEWLRRGYQNTMARSGLTGPLPRWFGDAAFHTSHRSNLLRKNIAHYSRFGWVEKDDLPYVWPVV